MLFEKTYSNIGIRINEVIMQRTNSTSNAKSTRRHVSSSTTLNRRYVKRPSRSMDMVTPIEVKKSPKIRRFSESQKSVKHLMITEPEAEALSMMESGEMHNGQTKQSYDMQYSQMPDLQTQMQMQTQMQTSVQGQMMNEQRMKETGDNMPQYVQPHPLQKTANERMQARKASPKEAKRPTAKELKDQAIQKALLAASRENVIDTTKQKNSGFKKINIGVGRVLLALSCAAVAVFAIVYFVNLNMPNVSLKVAAMQTGINASYPSYVPRDYSISSITSENKKIVLDFKNDQTGEKYSLVEETSSWDSNALLNNYVKSTYNDNYSTVKEQGLTIYLSGSNAVWVNGGVMYRIISDDGVLSNKQIRSIASSL